MSTTGSQPSQTPTVLRLGLRFLGDVLRDFKMFLGGGSAVVVALAIYERLSARPVSWVVYAMVVLWCLTIALFLKGFRQYQMLEPRMRISTRVFEQQEVDSTKPTAGPNMTYYIQVENMSKGMSIDNVHVLLANICPAVPNLNWLPVPLHIKHDNAQPYLREFRLNPLEQRHIDLVWAPAHPATICVLHAVVGVNNLIPARKYSFTVEATGNNVPPASAIFEVWIDHGGALRCVGL
jgi:hypothetical protein